MKINKKFLVGLSLALVMSVMVACGNKSDIDQNSLEGVKEKGKLIIGTSADYPPYEFHTLIDGKDAIVGFDMALGQHIADELGVELEIKEMDFKNLVGALPTGMVDMVIAGMSPDPKRDVNFSDIYYEATHGILVKKENVDNIKTEDDLKGKKAGVQMGSIQEKIAEGMDDVEILSLGLTNNLLMELKAGKIDYIIMEKPVAESYVKANSDLAVIPTLELTDEDGGGSAIAMKKGNDSLTEAINEILGKVKDEKLMDQWVIEANEIVEEIQN